jgi:predicted DNA-binding protein
MSEKRSNAYSVSLDDSQAKPINDYAKKLGLTKASVIRIAVIDFIEKIKATQSIDNQLDNKNAQ